MPRRLNATRHGLAGAAPVLPWENAEQRAELLEQLRGEHAPAGPTESHLVEELADILWRRRRLRRAEHAAHHDCLRRMTSDGASHVSSGESAWLATPLLLVSDTSRVAPGAVRDVLRLDQAGRRDALGALDARLEAARAAGRYAEGARATDGGIERRLDRASREAWYRAAAETPCDPGAEPSLFAWLHETLLPALDARRAVLVYADLIRDHLFASALDEAALERLQRHDAALDRRVRAHALHAGQAEGAARGVACRPGSGNRFRARSSGSAPAIRRSRPGTPTPGCPNPECGWCCRPPLPAARRSR